MSIHSPEKPLPQVIHEVRNALNTIAMSTEVAIKTISHDFDKDEVETLMYSILKQCHHCSATLEDLDVEK